MTRISTNMIHQQATSAMMRQQVDLARTQEQLSTGVRINTAADDPVAHSRISTMQSNQSELTQWERNANTAERRLNLTEGALAETGLALQRLSELAIQANNDTLDDEARRMIAAEVDQLSDHLIHQANLRDADGRYLFAGTNDREVAFARNEEGVVQYHGNTAQRQIPISPSTTIADTETGGQLFMDTMEVTEVIEVAGVEEEITTSMSVFDIADLFAEILKNPNPEEGSGQDPNEYFHQEMDKVIEGLQISHDNLLDARARVGARMTVIDREMHLNADRELELSTSISALRDTDYAVAVTELNRQQTALEAAQQSYLRVTNLSLFNYM